MALYPIYGKGVLTMGTTASPTDDVSCQVRGFTITSTAVTQPIPATLCAGAGVYAQPSTFSLSLEYMQDWGNTASLSELLNDNDGEPIFFNFVPDAVEVPSASGSCFAVAGDFGGEGQGLWVSTDELPLIGTPVYTPQV